MSQTVKAKQGGDIVAIDPNAASKMTPEGHRIDQHSNMRNPLYATSTEPVSNKDKLEAYSTNSTWGQHAEKSGSTWTKAILNDSPSVEKANNSSKEFETAALAIKGNDKDKNSYYGSVKWGWKKMEVGKYL